MRILLVCNRICRGRGLFHYKQRLCGYAQNTADFFGSGQLHGVAVKRAGAALFDLFDLFVRQTGASGQICLGPPQFFAAHTKQGAVDLWSVVVHLLDQKKFAFDRCAFLD